MEHIDRQAVIEVIVEYLVRRGFRVYAQTEHSAQLVRPKEFSFLLALLLLLLYVFPLAIYLLYFFAQKDETLYLVVDEQGLLSATDQDGVVSGSRLSGIKFDPGALFPVKERGEGWLSGKVVGVLIAILLILWVISFVVRMVS